MDDYIYVLDIAQLNRQKFTQNGKFITTEKPDLGVLTFRDIVAVGEGEFLIPANGKSESLILYKNINNDSTFYFGSAMGDSTITASRAENKKQVINGEVPDLLKNAVLLAHQDDSYYVFLRGYGRIQKYDRSGVLQWEKELKFPFIQELLNAAVENTKELQGGSVSLYTYAFDMDATDNGAYILMNAPQGKNQQLVWINKDGTGGKTYKINYPNSKFTVISVSPSQDQVYFINEPGAQILSLNLSTLK